ncbi:MAG: hypothetical protein ABI886_11525 [Betaproteobacteria bacterium]
MYLGWFIVALHSGRPIRRFPDAAPLTIMFARRRVSAFDEAQ